MKMVGVVVVLVGSLCGASAASAHSRYVSYVGDGLGRATHNRIVGNAMTLNLRDRHGSGTRYRVCIKRGASTVRCWRRTTGPAGRTSRIQTSAGRVGRHRAVWFVGGTAVDVWRYYVGIGD
jgi:hypothetical protein